MLLEDYRKMHGMSVKALAEHLGICRPTVDSYLINGVTIKCNAENVSLKTGGLVTPEDAMFFRSPPIDIAKAVRFYLENHEDGKKDLYRVKLDQDREKLSENGLPTNFEGQFPC